MSRKPKRGYYVKGHFVHEGSELDLELRRQAKGDVDISKSDLKRESEALQELGEELLTLRSDLMAPLELPDKLMEALADARRISNFEGKRRQMQFIGKLMRKLDDEVIDAVRAALQVQRDGSASELAALHQAEHWRERLLAEDGGDDALTEWLQQYPDTDIQQLRALIRQARKDAQAAPKEQPGAAQRHGRAYRELFQLVKVELLKASVVDTASPEDTDEDAAE